MPGLTQPKGLQEMMLYGTYLSFRVNKSGALCKRCFSACYARLLDALVVCFLLVQMQKVVPFFVDTVFWLCTIARLVCSRNCLTFLVRSRKLPSLSMALVGACASNIFLSYINGVGKLLTQECDRSTQRELL